MSIDDRPAAQVTPQVVVGVFIMLIGLLLMADNLGWAEAGLIWRLWPLVIAAIGVTMYRRAEDTPARLWAGFVTFVGVWLTLGRLFGWPLRLSTLWPIALVVIGVMIIRRSRQLDAQGAAISDSRVSDFAFWSGVQRRVASPVFRRGDLTVVMGGIELDLRPAGISGDAVLDLFVVMGGVEIRVPPDWSVSNQVVAIMGGASDKSTGPPDAKHRLVLRGFVLMGGVEVKT